MHVVPRQRDPPDSQRQTKPRRDRTELAPKSTLHCPICGHQSPADGDWLRRVGPTVGRAAVPVSNPVVGRGVALVCPDCESVVTVRRR
jgi:predicted RNA-binding Zn-ribbon protein involved in translation (DUF1610 family)